jgi:hypothetical protein
MINFTVNKKTTLFNQLQIELFLCVILFHGKVFHVCIKLLRINKLKMNVNFIEPYKMKKLLLIPLIFINTVLFAQTENLFQEISIFEIETRVAQNHKEGLSGFDNIYTKIVFEMEDFSLLIKNFDFLSKELKDNFSTEEFYLDNVNNRLIVTYEKSQASTDDFLKIFKETMQLKSVFMYLYEEKTLIKKQ